MNLHGLDIAQVHELAGIIAGKLVQYDTDLCSVSELRSEAVLQILLALSAYDAGHDHGTTPRSYAYMIAYFRVVDYIRSVKGYRRDRDGVVYTKTVDFRDALDDTGMTGDNIGSARAVEVAAREDEGIEESMVSMDHERTMRLLSETERTVITGRMNGYYQWQIGYHLGLTGGRVCQIEQRAKKRYQQLAA